MKKIKIYSLLVFALLAGVLGACDKEADQALKDIIKQDLGYLPVISSFTLVSPAPANVRPGATVTLDLRYWSEGQIDRVQLSSRRGTAGTPALIYDQNYTPAYSRVSRTDSLRVNYTIPADVAAGTRIRMEASVVNVGLPDYPRTATVELTVNP
jgi:hypothetical protein